MKKKLMVAGIAGISLVSMSVGAFGASNLEEVKAYLNRGLSITLHGQVWTPKDGSETLYPITYNDSTYLPLRAVAEAVGLEVGWDSSTQTVSLGKASAAPEVGKTSRSAPAAIGTTMNFVVSDYIDDYSGTVSVDEVLRGEQAWKKVQADNMFNSEPDEGYEYLLAKVTIKINENKKKDTKVDVSSFQFTLVSTDGRDYDYNIGTVVTPEISTSLYEGATHTGWVDFVVKKGDANPVIAYARNYDGSGGVWFATK